MYDVRFTIYDLLIWDLVEIVPTRAIRAFGDSRIIRSFGFSQTSVKIRLIRMIRVPFPRPLVYEMTNPPMGLNGSRMLTVSVSSFRPPIREPRQ